MIIVHKKLINIQSVSIPVMVHRSCLNLVLIVHVLCTYHVRVVNQSYFSTVHQLCLIFELQEDHQHVLDYALKLWQAVDILEDPESTHFISK